MTKLLKYSFSKTILKSNTNQVQGLAEYAIKFLAKGNPGPKVLQKTKLFHTDSVLTALSALALKTNAPRVLRDQALQHQFGKTKLPLAKVFGSDKLVLLDKAVVANCAAVREWDSNGTVFGYANDKTRQAGQFGHNDFYPVIIAAAHINKRVDGLIALKAMTLQDQIRGRLCEVFSLKTYKIDHVVHGAIASICVYGALINATIDQIQHGVGMFLAHYIPYRAIRADKQLSDSKGASAALSTEVAIMSINRAINGFIGPKDIFRNPQAIFRLNQKTNGDSPFDLHLSTNGDDFAVMGMHFKLGLYEHQSAGALQGLQKLILESKFTSNYKIDDIQNIKIIAYEPAFGIIGDPSRKDPKTRQSADHSMVYIISTLLRKAFEHKGIVYSGLDDVWKSLMLLPQDYGYQAIMNISTRKLIQKCTFEHGGKQYDEKYPEGIPTSIVIKLKNGTVLDSGLIMFPSGHSRNTAADLKGILHHKFHLLGRLALSEKQLQQKIQKLNMIQTLSNRELQVLYDCKINYSNYSIDDKRYVPLKK